MACRRAPGGAVRGQDPGVAISERRGPLKIDLRRDRHPPPGAERAVGDLQAWRCLFALEFGATNQAEDARHGGGVEASGDDLVRRFVVLDVTLQYGVEDVV